MYADFYGLHELPFNITPDPRFLYLNDCYQEALAALAYGIEARKGFISLIGEAGTGKTTLLRRLLDTLDARVKTVLLLNPTVDFHEVLEHILTELGVPTDGGGKLVLLQRLNEFLLEHTSSGGNVVLLIDEAQDLTIQALEELRLLSNLETAREKILQIVLAGQPELEHILRNPALRQLRQRVTLNVRVRPLTPVEVHAYVDTRLELGGARRLEVFTDVALDRVATLSRGIPRLVNVLCDASLMMGFVSGIKPVTPEIVDAAWNDYSLDPPADDSTPPAEPTSVVATPAAPVMITAPAPVIAVPETAPPAAPAAPPPVAEAQSAPETSADDPTVAVPSPAPTADEPIADAPEPVVAATVESPAPPVAPPPASTPSPAEPVAEAVAPTPPPAPRSARRAAPAPAAAPRATFSIPAAAALVAALAVGIYALSMQDEPIDPLAPAAVASQPAGDDATAPESGTAVAATPPPAATVPPPQVVAAVPPLAIAAPAPEAASSAPALPPLIEVIRPDGTPITAAEATEMVDQFRAAYETRDVERLVALFAPDAIENGRRGLDAIAASYRTTLGSLADVRYTLPSLAVAAGPHAAVRAPFVISFRRASGDRSEITGDAEWELERRDGRVRIVSLIYRLGAAS